MELSSVSLRDMVYTIKLGSNKAYQTSCKSSRIQLARDCFMQALAEVFHKGVLTQIKLDRCNLHLCDTRAPANNKKSTLGSTSMHFSDKRPWYGGLEIMR